MKRILVLGILFSLLTSHFSPLNAEGIADVFTTMPDSIFPLLTQKNRHDMVDFYNNKMEAKVRNRLNDYARLDTLTNQYLHLTLSQSSEATMRLLPTADSTSIICLVQTVTTPIRDSQVRFYNPQWQRLRGLQLPMPETADFFSETSDSVARDMQFAQRSIDDLRLVEVTVSPDEPVFELRLSVDELAQEEKKIARRYLRTLRYRWTGSGFLPMP